MSARRPARPVPVLAAAPIPTLREAPVDLGEEVERFDVSQRSPEWHALRLGMPTASVFGAIMASGSDGDAAKTRTKLLYRLAGERLSGQVAEDWSNKAMQRGIEMEPEARAAYAWRHQVPLTPVGFARRSLPRGRFVGASPDSQVGERGGLEIKTMEPALMVELVRSGRFPSEHRAQCQGTMWVLGWEFVDLVVFYRGMPVMPEWRVVRDDAYIREIARAVEVFDHELTRVVDDVRAKGRAS